MKNFSTSLLHRPNISVRWTIAAGLFWFVVLWAFDKTTLSKDLEQRVSVPSVFRARASFQESPQIHKSIKVYGIDDSTVSWLGTPNLPFKHWVILFEAISRKNPKIIIVDKMFTLVDTKSSKELRSLKKRLERIKTPIVVGAFVAPRQLKYRAPISAIQQDYLLSNIIRKSTRTKVSRETISTNLTLPKSRSRFIYGPDPKIRKGFRHIGHLEYYGNSRFSPYVRINGARALPHFMMYADPGRLFFNDELFIKSKKVPRFPDGTAPINFSEFRTFLKATRPLRFNLARAISGQELEDIVKGDYVYIIPSFFTGNTDFKMTPFGPMPAGYAHLAVLNSMITRNWITPIWHKEALIGIFCLLGAFVGLKASPIMFGFAVAGVLGGWLTLVFSLFIYQGVMIPWILPMIGFITTVVTIFVEKSRVAEKKSQYIRSTLDGVINPRELEQIAKNPRGIQLEARERIISIMFIDVVGFSLLAENQLPKKAFESLKNVLSGITDTVHSYGGIVNKNLGDGLLCIFGYSFESDEISFDHAEKAMECAIKIQKQNVQSILRAAEVQDPVYPLRIGINTSSVYMGNLGSDNRIDFTVVGNGVNFAKRLEGGCETHSVMLSATTMELIKPTGFYEEGMNKRFIEIKHHAEMVEVYEFDPFFENKELRASASEAHRLCTRLARVEKRWSLSDKGRVIVATPMGQAYLVNFSQAGLSLKLSTFIAKGAIINIILDSRDGRLRNQLAQLGLDGLELEVRWGYRENREFLHGAKFHNLSARETSDLLEILCQYSDEEGVKSLNAVS